MPPIPPPDPNAAPPDAGVSFTTFSGLKNTVAPESLTAREMTRAHNVDLDDLGQIHRRRGRVLKVAGNWTGVFTTKAPFVRTYGVVNGQLVLVNPNYTTQGLGGGYGLDPVAWVQVGPLLYFSTTRANGKIDIATNTVLPWGPAEDFWFSPVPTPDVANGLGQIGGKLLGPPPLATFLAYHNGRVYLGAGNVLWATELYLYDLVDKTKGFRQFEAPITGLVAVEDGVYVGTQTGLYFLAGAFTEHTRTLRERAGVIPGSMVQAPGELIDPEGRRFPDKPQQTTLGMACMTAEGVVVGLSGGQTFNLTRTNYVFPAASRAASLFRVEDGMGTLVVPLTSGGTPTDNAKFGDYLSGTIIRNPTPGQPGGTAAAIPSVTLPDDAED